MVQFLKVLESRYDFELAFPLNGCKVVLKVYRLVFVFNILQFILCSAKIEVSNNDCE